MLLRLVIIVSCVLWSASAQAQMSGGSSPGGTNYSCDGTNCTCDGSYMDCWKMEGRCKGKVSCGSDGKCNCKMKEPPPRSPTTGQPKRPVPGQVTPPVRQ